MSLAADLSRSAEEFPQHAAVGEGDRVVATYAELAIRVARIANALLGMGLRQGDRVAVIAKNSPAYLEALYAIWHAGLAAVPANAKLHGAELGYVLEHSGARVCFVSKEMESEVAPHAPASLERMIVLGGGEYRKMLQADVAAMETGSPDDLAWLFYTSGTTGRPKGAMLTHRNLAEMSRAYCDEVDTVSPGNAVLHAAPMSHG